MKKISMILLLIISLFVFDISCKKTDVPIKGNSTIIGSWKWIGTWNDGAPGPSNPSTPQNTGIQETFIFNPNYTWKKTTTGSAVESGSFSTGYGSYTPYKGAGTYNYDSIIYYNNGSTNVDYFVLSVTNDTLIFSSGFRGIIGGGSKDYVRQSN